MPHLMYINPLIGVRYEGQGIGWNKKTKDSCKNGDLLKYVIHNSSVQGSNLYVLVIHFTIQETL